MIWPAVTEAISSATGESFVFASAERVGGGCISQAYSLSNTQGQRYFVKTHTAELLEMFVAEAEGLLLLADSHSIKVPRPCTWGSSGDTAYLVMEFLSLDGSGSERQLGQQLAQMHAVHSGRFGWRRDNTIGSTPQDNTPSDDWAVFWRDRRLGAQLERAEEQGYSGRLLDQGERLLAGMGAFFTGYAPAASLLHGDLWSGNHAYTRKGEPVIFDPAVYFGDRETDLAMTELFGAYGKDFYTAYREASPLDPGYRVRKTLYNLYHILNHLNMFGGGYARQAEAMMDQLLSEIE